MPANTTLMLQAKRSPLRPFFPIIYVRGYAMTQSEIAATVATPAGNSRCSVATPSASRRPAKYNR